MNIGNSGEGNDISQSTAGGSDSKGSPAMQETRVQSPDWEDPLEKGMATHCSFFPGEFHGQRNLAGYSQLVHKQWDMTEQLTI